MGRMRAHPPDDQRGGHRPDRKHAEYCYRILARCRGVPLAVSKDGSWPGNAEPDRPVTAALWNARTVSTAMPLGVLFYELPDLNGAIFHASFYPCILDNACQGPEPWG
jgi:hypothetical protein